MVAPLSTLPLPPTPVPPDPVPPEPPPPRCFSAAMDPHMTDMAAVVLVFASDGIRREGCFSSCVVVSLFVADLKSSSLLLRRLVVTRTTLLHRLKCPSPASFIHLLSFSSPDLCSAAVSSTSRRVLVAAADLGQALESELLRLNLCWAWPISFSNWCRFGLTNFVGLLACLWWLPRRSILMAVADPKHGDLDRRPPPRFQAIFGYRVLGYFSDIPSRYFSDIFNGYFSVVSTGYSFVLFTGYFSGPSLLVSEVGPFCVQSSTTSAGSDLAYIWQRLLTRFFSGFPLPAYEVVSGRFQPTTLAGPIVVSTSQCLVTISSSLMFMC